MLNVVNLVKCFDIISYPCYWINAVVLPPKTHFYGVFSSNVNNNIKFFTRFKKILNHLSLLIKVFTCFFIIRLPFFPDFKTTRTDKKRLFLTAI
ncbi:hypothetical protein B738_05317 [Photorhabdus temperata subsp. temperata M1021]|nr:hypothetical protein B738_05317 [Photorhabdus temperata subsp. temperata M1021]